MVTLHTYMLSLSHFISTKYYKLGHWEDTGSCMYSTENNTENKISLKTQQTTTAKWEKVLCSLQDTAQDLQLSTGARFTPAYTTVIILELRWHYMDVTAGQTLTALEFFVQLWHNPSYSCTASRRCMCWRNKLITCWLAECPPLLQALWDKVREELLMVWQKEF